MSRILYTQKIKRPKKVKRKTKRRSIRAFAKSLRENPPKSELWFYSLYETYKDRHDQFNHPLHIRIPDVMNRRFQYIVEIDGSIHDSEKQKYTDYIKDSFYKRLGFEVIRIKAFDLSSFEEGVKRIQMIRKTYILSSKLNPD